jgi:tight adherence protein B
VAATAVAIAAMRTIRTARRLERFGVRATPSKPSLAVARTDASLLIVAIAVGWVLARGVGAFLGVVAFLITRSVRIKRSERVPAIVAEERTADAVGALAAAVRSGLSLEQAIRYAALEAASPVREELERVVAALDTGIALDVTLAAWADRREQSDTDLLVGALELHRRSGGDLPTVLDQVSDTIRDRVGIAREVRSLTAQARLSAWILGLLPIGFFAFLWLTSRRDIEGALSTPAGLVCVLVGLALEGGAFLWIRSLLEVT